MEEQIFLCRKMLALVAPVSEDRRSMAELEESQKREISSEEQWQGKEMGLG